MSAVTSHYVLHAHVLCVLRQSEVGGYGLASEDVGILLTDVVDRVDKRQHLRALHTVAADAALGELQFDTCQVALLCPCVDEHADVSLVLKQRVAVGDVLLPLHAVLPLRDVHRAALRCERVVVVAVEAHAERSHEAHQLDGRQIVFASDNAAHVLQLQRVNLGELCLALRDAQQVDGRVARQYEYRARLVPAVTVGSDCGLDVHLHVALVVRHLYLLQYDASVHKTNDAVGIRFVKSAEGVRSVVHVHFVEYLYCGAPFRCILLVACLRSRRRSRSNEERED